MNIDFFVNEFTKLWDQSPVTFPSFGKEYSDEDKLVREEGLIKFSKNMKNEIDMKSLDATRKDQLEFKVKSTFGPYFRNAFNFSARESALITNTGFTGVTKTFMKMARRFDPEVNIDDVFQASRNLWIVNSLQIMMDVPVTVTPSIFAYSMLYPYSDNYLDDQRITTQQKLEFSKRFRLRLEGEEVIPANTREKNIFDLVTLIEQDWDRAKYPRVFESLLAIHDAQTRSIFLMKTGAQLGYNELLSICIEKGGTSVLADGFLINGELTHEQEMFCFGFGTFLQFVDDIQDIDEDMEGKLETLFTFASTTGQLNEFTNRTIAFSNSVLSDLSCFPFSNSTDMRGLMTKSIDFMLTEAVGLNNKWFSNNYVDAVEVYSPFSFEFIRKRRNNLNPNRISLMKKIESFVFDEQKVAIQV